MKANIDRYCFIMCDTLESAKKDNNSLQVTLVLCIKPKINQLNITGIITGARDEMDTVEVEQECGS